MRRTIIGVVTLALLTAGCASTRWYRDGATEADFLKDRSACNYEAARAGDPFLASFFLPECLQGRGWVRGPAQ